MALAAIIEGVGIVGPGLTSWADACAVLSGAKAFVSVPTELSPPTRNHGAMAYDAVHHVCVLFGGVCLVGNALKYAERVSIRVPAAMLQPGQHDEEARDRAVTARAA